jgi:hypothetical protein
LTKSLCGNCKLNLIFSLIKKSEKEFDKLILWQL